MEGASGIIPHHDLEDAFHNIENLSKAKVKSMGILYFDIDELSKRKFLTLL